VIYLTLLFIFYDTLTIINQTPATRQTDRYRHGDTMLVNDDVASAPDDEDTDSCLCGIEHREDEGTPDEELPAASGGVEPAKQDQQDDENDIDGCGTGFKEAQPTADHDLPVAVGGV
jgi:hypothetical protein